MKSKLNQKGFGALGTVAVIVVLIGIGAAGYLVYRAHYKMNTHQPVANNSATVSSSSNPSNGQSSSVTSGSKSPRQTLQPESNPPVIDECTQPITTAQDGNVSPLFCPNGDLNVTAWKALAVTGHDAPMALGPSATEAQVVASECGGKAGMTGTIAQSQEQLAAAYNGWPFSSTSVENQV